MTLTIGALFSGIGGIELGLERAGLGPVLWQVENDPFCRRVLAKHWPHVARFEDVTTARGLPNVDLICGGFPCQDVSSAGARRGLGGQRSGLWYYFARIVRDIRPSFVVVENVASGKSRWLPTVRHQLHVLGYRTRALGIAARDVGAPHSRPRIFVIGHAYRDRKPVISQHGEVARVPQAASDLRCGWIPKPSDLRMADGVPVRMDRLRALGNAVVPQCAEVVGRIVLASAPAAQARR